VGFEQRRVIGLETAAEGREGAEGRGQRGARASRHAAHAARCSGVVDGEGRGGGSAEVELLRRDLAYGRRGQVKKREEEQRKGDRGRIQEEEVGGG
jgi:hypothetical protein